MSNEFSVTLRTGDTVEIFEYEGKLVLQLINNNGHIISDQTLSNSDMCDLQHEINKRLSADVPIEYLSGSNNMEFSDLILKDLIEEGYDCQAMLEEFIHRKSQIPLAWQKLVDEAIEAAKGKKAMTVEELFED
ncbi:hypothetical protein ACI2JA_03595 [Alkalihalobacillus sp. NPDC078783]